MQRPTRPMPAPWTVWPREERSPRPSLPGPGAPPATARPGIAARWKPRDRVTVGGN